MPEGRNLLYKGYRARIFFDGREDMLIGRVAGINGSITFRAATHAGLRQEFEAYMREQGVPVRMDLCMITPTAVDFDGDGDLDLICGDEDGRVAFIENTGKVVDGMPQFLPPRYFRQFAADVKFGALATPYAVDWDGDGLEDLITGNSAGYVEIGRAHV